MNQERLYSFAGFVDMFDLVVTPELRPENVSAALNQKFDEAYRHDRLHPLRFSLVSRATTMLSNSLWRFHVKGDEIVGVEEDDNGLIVDINNAPESIRRFVNPGPGSYNYYAQRDVMARLVDEAYSCGGEERVTRQITLNWMRMTGEVHYVEISNHRTYQTFDFPTWKRDVSVAISHLLGSEDWIKLVGVRL